MLNSLTLKQDASSHLLMLVIINLMHKVLLIVYLYCTLYHRVYTYISMEYNMILTLGVVTKAEQAWQM